MLKRIRIITTNPTIINAILPVCLSLSLFVGAVFVFALPAFEKTLMTEKKKSVTEVTNLVWGLLDGLDQRVKKGEIDPETARELARQYVGNLRYGPDNKDYFWIQDKQPRMVMHPYQTGLNGTDLSRFTDKNGNYLFVDAVRAVQTNGRGFIRYMWQWQDNPQRIAPKLSFVREFKPWGWIIGTGVYTEDVSRQIRLLSRNLKYIFSFILLCITLLFCYIIWQSGKREKIKSAAEAALKSSEERYRTILQIFEDGYFEVDLQGNMTFCNDAMSKLVGYPKDELIGMNNRSYMDHETAHKVYTVFNETYATGQLNKGIDWKVTQPDGARKWVECSVTLIRDENGRPSGFRGVVRDISERKSYEETLQKARNRYQAVVEDMPSMIVRFRPDYVVTFANENYCRNLNTERDQLIGKNLEGIVPEEDWPRIKTHYESLSRENPMKTYIRKSVSPLGAISWSEWTDRALFSDRGELTEYQSIGYDITEKKQAAQEKDALEKQLRHSRKMESIGTLTGGIAHDFNNILSIILGNTEIALDDLSEWDPTCKNLSEIRNATLRAKDLIQQLLSFSRKTEPLFQPVMLESILNDTLILLRSAIPSTITIRQKVIPPISTIKADPTQIHQILLNLCTNAFHAMEDRNGRLDITIRNRFVDESDITKFAGLRTGDHVLLEIRDNGTGMEPDVLEKIFDPYFTTKAIGKGTGMGLSVVHGIVKSHRGFIRVESQINEGTCFQILFPAIDVELKEKQPVTIDILHGTGTILFVDDEELIVQIAQKQLERIGFHVEAETSPVRALRKFRADADRFDLVITDMTMPRMSGEDLIRAIKSIRPLIPVIICTGYNDKITEAVSQKIGAGGLLMKPFGIEELARVINSLIGQKGRLAN